MLIPHMMVEVASLLVDCYRIGFFLLWVVVDLMVVNLVVDLMVVVVARLLMDLGRIA